MGGSTPKASAVRKITLLGWPAMPVSDEAAAFVRGLVIRDDSGILAFNQPAGLAVHGGSAISAGLIELSRQVWPEIKQLELVHRLDRDTSGCIILAKKTQVLKAMHQMFKNDSLEKTYLAISKGYWPAKLKILDAPLRKHILQSGERMVKVQSDGKLAETHVRVKQRMNDCTLLEITLKTGRTHQIRVHTQHAGFPILGDHKYGDGGFNDFGAHNGLKRMFLHASSLKFNDPVTGELIDVLAPLDKPWTDALKKLA